MKRKAKPTRKPERSPGRQKAPKGAAMLGKVEAHFERHRRIYLWTAIILSVVLALTQFNYKVSEANDDSMYLEDAFMFSKDFFGYYTANAPFYSMLLSLVVRVAGFDLTILKMTGFLFMTLHLYFMYRAFATRVPYFPLFMILFFCALNHYLLYFASMTFTEQFFLMQQGLFLWLFFRAHDRLSESSGFISQLKLWLPVGLILFILSMSRNLAIGIVVPVVVYLAIYRHFRPILAFGLSFLIFRLPFELLRKTVWGGQNQYSNQVTKLLSWKDPYDPTKGTEDLAGFIDRFTGNYGLYISKRFYQILGFLSDTYYTVKPGLGFIFFVLMAIALIYVIRKKDRQMIFVFLYTGALCGITFVAVQTRWDQLRFILIFVPLILLFISAAYFKMSRSSGWTAQFIYLVASGLIITSVTISTIKRSADNLPVVQANLKGDIFYGYTPDWQNYLKLSRWCADSLPESAYVACRKAPMSFIYARGKQFFPVYQADIAPQDSVIDYFREQRVTHFILGSLRRNPRRSDGYIINTVHRLFQPTMQKHPERFTFVKKMGEAEPAYLYRINY